MMSRFADVDVRVHPLCLEGPGRVAPADVPRFALKLSTRPENYLGEIEVWDKAEALMTEARNDMKP